MATKWHRPEEIVLKLRQVDVLVGQGMARVDAIRQASITEQNYYRLLSTMPCIACRAKGVNSAAGAGTDKLKDLKKLQKENGQLRRAVADLTIDKQILAEAVCNATGTHKTEMRGNIR